MIVNKLAVGADFFCNGKKMERVMFDTNVLSFIYNPDMDSSSRNSERHKRYSDLFGFFLREEIEIFIPEIVLLEYINISLKEKKKRDDRDRGVVYKGKIHTHPRYKEWYKEVLCDIEDIIEAMNIVYSSSNPNDFLSFLEDNLGERIDVNDLTISILSIEKDIPLVTDDGDFSSQSDKVNIISFNERINSSKKKH